LFINKQSRRLFLFVLAVAFTAILLMQAGFAFAIQAPTINPNGGTFTSTQSVTIGNIPDGDTAYYTTDGSNPVTSNTAVIFHSGSFTVSQSGTVKAAVYDPVEGWSSVTSAKFIIDNQPVNDSDQITELKKQFADAVSNNQMKLAKKILQEIKRLTKHNQKNEYNINSLNEQLIDAVNNNNWDQAEKILKQIIKLEKSNWAYSELGKIYQKKGKNNVCVFTDGDEINFDVQPIIIKGRTLIPIRKVANVLGLSDNDVKWDPNGTVTIINGSNKILILNNAQQVYLNGSSYTIDVPAQIVNGRMLVPLRAIGELFERNVQWYPNGKIVSII